MNPATERACRMERLDVSAAELEVLLEGARQEPLREEGYQKLKAAIHTLGYVTELLEKQETTLAALRRLLCPARTEKTSQVLEQAGIETGEKKPKPPGTGAMALPPIAGRARSRFGMRR